MHLHRLSGVQKALLILAIFLAGCSVRRDYQAASKLNTVEAYTQFLQEHPEEDQYFSLARERLEELSYEKARKEDSFPAYAGFVANFPYGRFSPEAQKRAEDIRATELGIHLYREFPQDFYESVNSSALPFRIQVLSQSPDEEERKHVERSWYEELVGRDLFVPLDPRKAYPFPPDLTLRVRQSTLFLCTYPWTQVDADVSVRGKHVRSYKVAAQRIEKFLLYEIYRDSERYRGLMRIPEPERQTVEERFQRLRRIVPLAGSVSLEFEIDQRGSHWDQEMIRGFLEFLRETGLSEDLSIYPRGQPPTKSGAQRLYLRVDPEFHHPLLHKQWNFASPSPDWSAWNSAWILMDRDYFYKKMTLDLVDLLQKPEQSNEGPKKQAPGRTWKKRQTPAVPARPQGAGPGSQVE